MKDVCSFVLIFALLFVPVAYAEQIFVDDYEGMIAGADLTNVLRTPTLGPANSAGWISASGSATAQVVAALDGMAANVNVPKESAIDYLAYLQAEYGNGRFLVEWALMVDKVNNDRGLFAVRFPTPGNSMQILFGFLNDGRLIRFNDTPSAASLIKVGQFIADTRYNVQLIYDLATDRYSVALNGVDVIVDVPIPTYLDAVSIDRFGFDINQTSNIPLPDMPVPEGNNYIVDNVHFSRIEAVPEPATLLLLGLGLMGVAGVRRRMS